VAKNGFRIFDSDTHVGPYADVLDPYIDETVKAKLPAWEEYRVAHHKTGHITYVKGQRRYRRRLGDAEPDPTPARYMAGFAGAETEKKPNLQVDDDPELRIADLDYEGTDVNLMVPSGWFGTWTTGDDAELEMGMYQAYHRWMDVYCGAYPDRLGGVVLCSGRNVDASLAELKRWGAARWAWGMMIYAPSEMPLDHPDLDPLWAAASDYDLAVVLHTFTVMPPYAPGGEDTWGNIWLQRSAAHPWCGMRNMASVIGSGAMARYPGLRVATLEAGHGWLPFWMARIDEHTRMARAGLPEDFKGLPSDYILGGRYYQSVDVSEGEGITKSVIDLVGEDLLMYASDYPHGGGYFPRTADIVIGWDMPDEHKRKLLWDNAVKLYARCGL
jgi:predicted TIM-barrel fold metal-dependent hydrolase